MNINDLTVGQVKEITSLFGGTATPQPAGGSSHWEIGKPYLIRTVTMIDTGILVAVTDQELVLTDAAWIADTGRFSDALASCQFSEVEPFPEGSKVIINRTAIIDAVRITEPPRKQK